MNTNLRRTLKAAAVMATQTVMVLHIKWIHHVMGDSSPLEPCLVWFAVVIATTAHALAAGASEGVIQ